MRTTTCCAACSCLSASPISPSGRAARSAASIRHRLSRTRTDSDHRKRTSVRSYAPPLTSKMLHPRRRTGARRPVSVWCARRRVGRSPPAGPSSEATTPRPSSPCGALPYSGWGSAALAHLAIVTLATELVVELVMVGRHPLVAVVAVTAGTAALVAMAAVIVGAAAAPPLTTDRREDVWSWRLRTNVTSRRSTTGTGCSTGASPSSPVAATGSAARSPASSLATGRWSRSPRSTRSAGLAPSPRSRPKGASPARTPSTSPARPRSTASRRRCSPATRASRWS